MPELTSQLQTLRASTADLLRGLDAAQWSDADVAAESLCRGWTRGHVLTHLARNADGIAATLQGALHGEIVPRYPAGWDARNADIEAGAGRPAAALLTDVRESAERLDRVLGAVHEADAWDRPTEGEHPAEHWLSRRWKEVEFHRVDLAGDYTPRRWPAQLVSFQLPSVLDELAERSERALLVTITADGSLVPELAGRTWPVDGAGEQIEVAGPDWAVLAWATGRGAVVRDVLPEQPELADWQ
jgi:maleylpyruvate isomerase